MPSLHPKRARLALAPLLALLLAGSGCSRPAPPATTFHWWMGRTVPRFDPDGPPDPARLALERLLTRSLVEEDTLGRAQLSAARSLVVSPDRLHYTFRLRRDLRFTDGQPCRSVDFRAALAGGLARGDHSTRTWLLRAVKGVDAVRARKPLPPLGLSTPDDTTLVIDLARPDSLLLSKLAAPGVSSAWVTRDSSADWKNAVGLGPYRVIRSEAAQIRMVRSAGTGPDTVVVRFALGAARARAALRSASIDLLWPLPPGLQDEALPAGYRSATGQARPRRWLALVMRADVPPTTKLPARRALAHGIPRNELARRAGWGAREVREWMPGGGPANLPSLDQAELQRWLERGKLGRSFHATLAYDADGPGAEVARSLQGDWSRYGLYLDLLPLRGEAMRREALAGQTQVLLVEYQGLTADPAGVLAPLVMPFRGPAIGTFRTGWRTREFDRWLAPGTSAATLAPAYVERRVEEETVVLPLAELGWVWLARSGGPSVAFHPRFGPSCPALGPRAQIDR